MNVENQGFDNGSSGQIPMGNFNGAYGQPQPDPNNKDQPSQAFGIGGNLNFPMQHSFPGQQQHIQSNVNADQQNQMIAGQMQMQMQGYKQAYNQDGQPSNPNFQNNLMAGQNMMGQKQEMNPMMQQNQQNQQFQMNRVNSGAGNPMNQMNNPMGNFNNFNQQQNPGFQDQQQVEDGQGINQVQNPSSQNNSGINPNNSNVNKMGQAQMPDQMNQMSNFQNFQQQNSMNQQQRSQTDQNLQQQIYAQQQPLNAMMGMGNQNIGQNFQNSTVQNMGMAGVNQQLQNVPQNLSQVQQKSESEELKTIFGQQSPYSLSNDLIRRMHQDIQIKEENFYRVCSKIYKHTPVMKFFPKRQSSHSLNSFFLSIAYAILLNQIQKENASFLVALVQSVDAQNFYLGLAQEKEREQAMALFREIVELTNRGDQKQGLKVLTEKVSLEPSLQEILSFFAKQYCFFQISQLLQNQNQDSQFLQSLQTQLQTLKSEVQRIDSSQLDTVQKKEAKIQFYQQEMTYTTAKSKIQKIGRQIKELQLKIPSMQKVGGILQLFQTQQSFQQVDQYLIQELETLFTALKHVFTKNKLSISCMENLILSQTTQQNPQKEIRYIHPYSENPPFDRLHIQMTGEGSYLLIGGKSSEDLIKLYSSLMSMSSLNLEMQLLSEIYNKHQDFKPANQELLQQQAHHESEIVRMVSDPEKGFLRLTEKYFDSFVNGVLDLENYHGLLNYFAEGKKKITEHRKGVEDMGKRLGQQAEEAMARMEVAHKDFIDKMEKKYQEIQQSNQKMSGGSNQGGQPAQMNPNNGMQQQPNMGMQQQPNMGMQQQPNNFGQQNLMYGGGMPGMMGNNYGGGMPGGMGPAGMQNMGPGGMQNMNGMAGMAGGMPGMAGGMPGMAGGMPGMAGGMAGGGMAGMAGMNGSGGAMGVNNMSGGPQKGSNSGSGIGMAGQVNTPMNQYQQPQMMNQGMMPGMQGQFMNPQAMGMGMQPMGMQMQPMGMGMQNMGMQQTMPPNMMNYNQPQYQ